MEDKIFGKWRVQVDKDEKDRYVVSFYDMSQDSTKFPQGQFTGGRYFVKDLLHGDEYNPRSIKDMKELHLDNGIPAWTVENKDLVEIYKWLQLFDDESIKDVTDNTYFEELEDIDVTKDIIFEELEDADRDLEAENLKAIQDELKRNGIKNERTLNLLSKDVYKILCNNYDDDTKMDGIYLQPAILSAMADKIQQITGKRPEYKIG